MMIPGDLSCFTIPDDDEEIRRRISVNPEAIANLAGYGIAEGTRLIEVRLKSVFTATPQTIRLTREFCGIGLAYLRATYSDAPAYAAKCNTNNLVPIEPRSATALIGLGGSGKSQLLRAVGRLVTPIGAEIHCPGLPVYPVQAMWILTMVAGKSLSNLLEPFVPNGGSGNAVLKPAAKRAFTNYIGLNALDESQFITATQEGHAKAAEVLMRLTYIGPPFVFVANFTMINKLEKRPQQERDRLLSNVLVLHPEEHGSDAFENILSDQLVVLTEAVSSDLAISAKNHAHDIHNYTYGINRKSAILLTHGWRISRERGSSILTMDDVRSAYKSDRFRSHRDEVEILKRQSNNRRMEREDLWCGFAPPPSLPPPLTPLPTTNTDTTTSSNVISVPELQEEKEKRIADEMTRATMSKSEREAYDSATNRDSKFARPKARVVRLSKEDRSLAVLQASGAEMLEKFTPRP